jgi:hypothetical protein
LPFAFYLITFTLKTRPEFDLLVCLARAAPGHVEQARARELLRSPVDWDYFVALSWRHGLMPLAARNLLDSFAGEVPAAHLQRLRREFRHNAARNLLLVSELCGVIEALGREGVETVAYKGPALALQAYGDIKLRSFVDLDLLVRPRDAARASEVLAALGYRPHLRLSPAQERMLPRSECDRVFLREGRNLMLELHWAVAPPFFSVPVGAEEVLAERPMRLALCEGGVTTPAPALTLLLLSVNGAKDLWVALEPLAAVAELLRRRAAAGLDLQRAAWLARRAGALRMLLVCLELARRMFAAQLPEEIRAEARADRAVAPLVAEAARRLASAAPPHPGLSEKTRFRVRARERRRDQLRYCALKLLTPTYRDCTPELPRSLSFLYYGVRPLRLLRDLLKGPKAGAVL